MPEVIDTPEKYKKYVRMLKTFLPPKICICQKKVVPLQRNEEVDITYRLLGVAGDGYCADAGDDIGGFGGLYYAALLPSG